MIFPYRCICVDENRIESNHKKLRNNNFIYFNRYPIVNCIHLKNENNKLSNL